MEKDKLYFRVGFFIIITFFTSVISLTWFNSNKLYKKDTTAYVIFFDGSVNGLTIGSPVKLKGIQVGEVKEIDFSEFDNNFIRVLVEIVDTAPIRSDSVATLQPNGISGTSYVYLENTGNNTGSIVKKDGAEFLEIPSKPSELEIVFASMPALLSELSMLTRQGHKLLSNDNVKLVKDNLDSMDSILQEGKITLRELKMLIKSLRQNPSQLIRGPKYKGYKTKK